MSLILTGNASSLTIDSTNGITFPSATTQNTAYQTRFKNRIINGDMRIDQRNAGASVTPSTGAFAYITDRWNVYVGQNSKCSFQQNAGSVTPPVGFTNYLGVTSSSAYSVVSTDIFEIGQCIEGLNCADLGWGTANAKTITLSFWVRSSLTGVFGGSLQNSAGNRSYPFTYTINSANTWEFQTITISGDTSGTWLTTNGIGVRISFGFGVGSTYSGTAGSWSGSAYWSATGATSVVGTNGATFYITGVQLEVGSAASAFEYVDYGNQLFSCQRYYQKSLPIGTAPSSASGNYGATISAPSNGTNYIWANHLYRVPMRTTPTLTFYTANGGASGYVRTTASGTNLAVTAIDWFSESGIAGFTAPGATTGTLYDWIYTASAEL